MPLGTVSVDPALMEWAGAGLFEARVFPLQHGRLHRVTAPVSRDLEITEITDRVSKGPPDRNVALLFERVEGFDMPVLINAFGAPDRMAWALGVERLDELGERVARLLDLRMPGTFAERLAKLDELRDTGLITALMRMAPGARLPDHEHVKIEQTYVLEGELHCSEGICKAGQFVWRPAGSRHEAWAGPKGGLFLAMFQIPNRFFESDGREIPLPPSRRARTGRTAAAARHRVPGRARERRTAWQRRGRRDPARTPAY